VARVVHLQFSLQTVSTETFGHILVFIRFSSHQATTSDMLHAIIEILDPFSPLEWDVLVCYSPSRLLGPNVNPFWNQGPRVSILRQFRDNHITAMFFSIPDFFTERQEIKLKFDSHLVDLSYVKIIYSSHNRPTQKLFKTVSELQAWGTPIWGCIQKFPDWVDNERNNNNK
jgi:hypothetical protein